VKKIQVAGKTGREMVIIEMDSWELKENVMREKKKLGGRNIFIDHDEGRKRSAEKIKRVYEEGKIGRKESECRIGR